MNSNGIMICRLRTQILAIVIFLLLFTSGIPFQAHLLKQGTNSFLQIPADAIIYEGIQIILAEQKSGVNPFDRFDMLVDWFNAHPSVEFASGIETSITVKFIDGSYVVLLDPFSEGQRDLGDMIDRFVYERFSGTSGNTAVILNPAESMYGHYQCQRIITTLLHRDYSIEYLANQAVDVAFLKNNLSADIIYMNTHAGYFDVDGDSQPDTVVIATGELWTNETEQKYPDDIENYLIVKGMVGNQGFVTFTPAFIATYYAEKHFPGSLVYMATCYALYDSSMAQEFLDAGATVYMGWSQNTVFWTNSRTSVQAFHLLSYGFSVQQVCRLIRSGGLYNWLFHSKLLYFGDGTYTMP
jgi:hypothetical protein